MTEPTLPDPYISMLTTSTSFSPKDERVRTSPMASSVCRNERGARAFSHWQQLDDTLDTQNHVARK